MAHSHKTHLVIEHIEQQRTRCVICQMDALGARGEAYCSDCNIVFQIPKPSRKEMLSVFLIKYFMSRNSPFYHRAGCKYLRNVNPENLIETTEPVGKACLCVR